MKRKRCRVSGRDLLLILCTWLLACWAILAALELPSRRDQAAGIVVALAAVVTLTYLLEGECRARSGGRARGG